MVQSLCIAMKNLHFLKLPKDIYINWLIPNTCIDCIYKYILNFQHLFIHNQGCHHAEVRTCFLGPVGLPVHPRSSEETHLLLVIITYLLFAGTQSTPFETTCGSKCWHNNWERRDNRASSGGCWNDRWSRSYTWGGRCYCCSCCQVQQNRVCQQRLFPIYFDVQFLKLPINSDTAHLIHNNLFQNPFLFQFLNFFSVLHMYSWVYWYSIVHLPTYPARPHKRFY